MFGHCPPGCDGQVGTGTGGGGGVGGGGCGGDGLGPGGAGGTLVHFEASTQPPRQPSVTVVTPTTLRYMWHPTVASVSVASEKVSHDSQPLNATHALQQSARAVADCTVTE